MKLFKLALFSAAAALTVMACGDDETETAVGDDCGDVETLIMEIDSDCDATEWWHWAKTDGWTTDGAVNIDQTGVDPSIAWSEEHDLGSIAFDACWDEVEVRLPITTDWEAQEPNVNTLFECNDPRKSTLTWMIRVWDTDNVMSDCAVWGHNVSFYDEFGCLAW